MNSDELGEKGESRFKEICADVGLICNKADRDRTGWDFIVEFPFAAKEKHLDSRRTPFSCHVQVKTLFESSKTFKMRLSSAERLAKELKPACIFVFKVSHDLRFTNAFLIHLLDNRLAAVLKRLREEEAKGTPAIRLNKKSISLTPSAAERLAPTGIALRAALEAVCGKDMHAYSQVKNGQLRELGFGVRPVEGQMTLRLSPDDDIGEVFLGLRKEVPVLSFQTFTNRFGIKLPDIEAQSGKVTIEPHAADQCSIAVHDESETPSAVFLGEVFVSPLWPAAPDSKGVRVASNLFALVFSGKSYEFSYDINSPKREPIQGWRKFWRMALALGSGRGTIRIVSQTRPMDLRLDVTANTAFPEAEECRYWMQVCDDASYLLEAAGVHPEPSIEFDDIQSNADEIRIAAAFLREKPASTSLSVDFTVDSEDTMPTTERLAAANILSLGPLSLGYYRLAHMVSDPTVALPKLRLTSTSVSPSQIKLLPKGKDTWDDFIASVMKAEDLAIAIRVDAASLS